MEKEECIDWIRAYRAAGFPWRRRVCPRLFLGCPDFVGAGGFRGGGVGFQLPVVRPKRLRLWAADRPYRGDTFFTDEELDGVAFELGGVTFSVFHMLSQHRV